ncbi:MAG: acyl-CoA desaturase [Deltaproteobacteria bacterium]
MRRADAYFETNGLSRDGGLRLAVKALVFLGWTATAYLLLLLWSEHWWTTVPLAISLGLAMAGIGFSVMHDANHGAFSTSRTLNGMMRATLDVIGGSSYIWRFKHNVLHHTYPNIDGVDDDLDAGGVLRLAPTQPRRWFHRAQHLYELPVLGLLAAKWHLIDDWMFLVRARIGETRFPRPRGADLALLLAGKVVFFTWAVAIPVWMHGPKLTFLVGAITSVVLGMTLGIVFQLAHVCGDALLLAPPEQRERYPLAWAEHQVATTVDFATGHRFLSWYVGGLNFQVEHHLFPHVSHVHYPALARIVRETCAEFSVPLLEHATLKDALAAHFRHVAALGRPRAEAPEPAAVGASPR